MKAITIKQPWASLIIEGIKDIENRTWATKYRGHILIHSSAKSDTKMERLTSSQWKTIRLNGLHENRLNELNSAIIGSVEIVDCVVNHNSIWAEQTEGCCIMNGNCVGCHVDSVFCLARTGRKNGSITEKFTYNWILANPVKFENPILNVKGKLSLWNYEEL